MKAVRCDNFAKSTYRGKVWRIVPEDPENGEEGHNFDGDDCILACFGGPRYRRKKDLIAAWNKRTKESPNES
jgi:hypothetical protein